MPITAEPGYSSLAPGPCKLTTTAESKAWRRFLSAAISAPYSMGLLNHAHVSGRMAAPQGHEGLQGLRVIRYAASD